jgi:hypothetical protein
MFGPVPIVCKLSVTQTLRHGRPMRSSASISSYSGKVSAK